MSSDKDLENNKNKKGAVWPQWLAAMTLCLSTIVSGLANGWTSPYLAQLTSPETNTPLKLTEDEASWVASLLNLGRLLGALFTAICQEYTGRKRTILLGSLPLAMSWVLNICATSVTWLYTSRFCSGVGSGMIWPALSLYLGEIADPKIRGSLISVNVNASSVGLFLGTVMGPYLSMEMFAYVSLLPNILFVIFFSLIPESPYHYVLHDDIDKAEASLKWFRRQPDVKAEIQELQDFVHGAGTNTWVKMKELVQPGNLKKAMMLLCLNFFVYLCGYTAINSYAEIIVINCGVKLTPSIVVMGMGFSMIVAGWTTILLVDRFGRKCLLMASGVGVAISLGLLGLHFHLLSLGFDHSNLTWLPITSLLAFDITVCFGLVPVPGSLLSELFPASLKNLASFVISSGNAVFAFMSARTYQPYFDLVGDKYVFWTYALTGLITVPYVHFLVPETKGKSLLEIQKSLK